MRTVFVRMYFINYVYSLLLVGWWCYCCQQALKISSIRSPNVRICVCFFFFPRFCCIDSRFAVERKKQSNEQKTKKKKRTRKYRFIRHAQVFLGIWIKMNVHKERERANEPTTNNVVRLSHFDDNPKRFQLTTFLRPWERTVENDFSAAWTKYGVVCTIHVAVDYS